VNARAIGAFVLVACGVLTGPRTSALVLGQEAPETAKTPPETKGERSGYVPDLVPGRAPTDEEVARAEQDVAAHPDDFYGVRALGKVYFYRFFGAGEKEAAPRARKALDRAREMRSQDAETIAFQGALARLTGRAKEGIDLFKQAREIGPDNIAVLGLLSGFGDVSAMERLRTLPAFARMSHHGQQRVLLGLAKDQARKGATEKARATLEEALQLNRETPEARMIRAALGRLP
jgi:tetratricopeptide (TPR) repeat protein